MTGPNTIASGWLKLSQINVAGGSALSLGRVTCWLEAEVAVYDIIVLFFWYLS